MHIYYMYLAWFLIQIFKFQYLKLKKKIPLKYSELNMFDLDHVDLSP